MELQNDIETDINPLITNAKMVVNDLTSKMPTVISKLKGKLNIKTIQQQLSDLTNSAQILTELSDVVDEKVTASIQSTTLQTLDMLKNTGVNVGALKNKINRDEEFKMQLLKKIESVRESKQREFKEITALSQNVLENKKTSTQLFLDSYSSNTINGLDNE
jgi:septum formation inhibitor MinC